MVRTVAFHKGRSEEVLATNECLLISSILNHKEII